MKWKDYHERFPDWDDHTQISLIPALTDFTSAAEVAEIAAEFCDDEAASQLIHRALQNGVRFSPAEIIGLGCYVTEETLIEAVKHRRGQFSAEEYETLEGFCFDEALLASVAKAGSIKRDVDDLPFSPQIALIYPIKTSPSLFGTLLDIDSDTGSGKSRPE